MKKTILLLLLLMPMLSLAADDPAGTLQKNERIELRTESSAIPFKQDEVITVALVSKVFVGLVIAITLAVFSIYIMRRFNFVPSAQSPGGRRIRLLETQRLSTKTTVFLVEIDQQTFLLSQAGDHVNVTAIASAKQEL
ncbi:MAG: flagellar biosynthetic protein FliO [Gammaproteobacteria bacterium]|nr:flagellar biosynthetic protein FliO [Gammaproteobacteria bacterium]